MPTTFDEPDAIEHLDFQPQCEKWIGLPMYRCKNDAHQHVAYTVGAEQLDRVLCLACISHLDTQKRITYKGKPL